jgi:hypothetical protein
MAWETRKRGGQYYTQSVRVGGRVTRRYLGCGEAAVLIARMEDIDRDRRQTEREIRRMEHEDRAALEAVIQPVIEAADLWARVALVAAGYHQHQRGEWRRKRESSP